MSYNISSSADGFDERRRRERKGKMRVAKAAYMSKSENGLAERCQLGGGEKTGSSRYLN
jgi:hypothetical protein